MVTELAVAMWFAPPHMANFPCAVLQVSKPAQKIRPVLHNCPASKSWIQALSGGRVTRILSTRGWSSCVACFFLFCFLWLALYPVNSALLVDSAQPSFCVPSSFYWLDLWRLFAGCLNGFRQLLELVWTPEALTKSTLYPGPTGMGSSIITREADLEVPHGNRKHKLDAHQKRITKKTLQVQFFPQLLQRCTHPNASSFSRYNLGHQPIKEESRRSICPSLPW